MLLGHFCENLGNFLFQHLVSVVVSSNPGGKLHFPISLLKK